MYSWWKFVLGGKNLTLSLYKAQIYTQYIHRYTLYLWYWNFIKCWLGLKGLNKAPYGRNKFFLKGWEAVAETVSVIWKLNLDIGVCTGAVRRVGPNDRSAEVILKVALFQVSRMKVYSHGLSFGKKETKGSGFCLQESQLLSWPQCSDEWLWKENMYKIPGNLNRS